MVVALAVSGYENTTAPGKAKLRVGESSKDELPAPQGRSRLAIACYRVRSDAASGASWLGSRPSVGPKTRRWAFALVGNGRHRRPQMLASC